MLYLEEIKALVDEQTQHKAAIQTLWQGKWREDPVTKSLEILFSVRIREIDEILRKEFYSHRAP